MNVSTVENYFMNGQEFCMFLHAREIYFHSNSTDMRLVKNDYIHIQSVVLLR